MGETERQEWDREDTGVGERKRERERQRQSDRSVKETGVREKETDRGGGERKIKRDSGWERERLDETGVVERDGNWR